MSHELVAGGAIPPLTVKAAIDIAGGLSEPSKMPGYSYGLPAEECKVGSKLVGVAGSTCANCYVLSKQSNYQRFAFVIKPAQYKHLSAIQDARWVDAMCTLIQWGANKSKCDYFRWHDSGDVQSAEHLAKIVEIAERLPLIKFWLPTREYGIVKAFIANHGENAIPANLTIRVSAHMVDGPLPRIGSLPSSGVHSHELKRGSGAGAVQECVARYQDGKCGDCRACWSKDVKAVSYYKH